MENKIFDILLVEDNPDDIEITKRAFKSARIVNRLYIVRDGKEALDFLYHQGDYAEAEKAPRPGLILLDINMPKLNGIEVLKYIKGDNALRQIPVIMLTVSKSEEDTVKSYDLGCNSFIQKPVRFEKFLDLIKTIGMYWGVINIHPEK
ncbi:MAG: response regulator [Candidatus Omnitrophica bacterium]|nr:response regulator [Candidatus Omnitrophota bacterium]MBU4477644.1 response regulator [Candidatus Omnitrophota bacterium]MCG2703134.1 response regulator [Candidatus Omnitrophota bacterium]